MGRKLGDNWHGSRTGYELRKCRCEACASAGRSWLDKRAAQRLAGNRRDYERAYREANREKNRSSAREWAERNREQSRAINKAWMDANKERRSEYNKKWRAENKERVREMEARFREKYPDRYKAKNRAQRLRRKLGMDATGQEWCQIILLDPCGFCGGPSSDVEHIIPIARGGDSSWENLAPACSPCNAQKATKSLLEYLLGKVA